MKKYNYISLIISGFVLITLIAVSCKKDTISSNPTPVVTPTSASFVENFDDVGNLTARGWAFMNNSNPIGATGWRQGRYEPANVVQYKFLAPVTAIGFPAFNSTKTPNDFMSCDASAVNDNGLVQPNISAWLISPAVPMKEGDQITFYTRAMVDANYPVFCKDRMQVRANFIDGSVNVGTSDTDTGNFKSVLLDINKIYDYNDPAGTTSGQPGYPMAWKKYTITLDSIPGNSVQKARFAFRYLGTDAGIFGGLGGNNYPTVVGLDNVVFKHN